MRVNFSKRPEVVKADRRGRVNLGKVLDNGSYKVETNAKTGQTTLTPMLEVTEQDLADNQIAGLKTKFETRRVASKIAPEIRLAGKIVVTGVVFLVLKQIYLRSTRGLKKIS